MKFQNNLIMTFLAVNDNAEVSTVAYILQIIVSNFVYSFLKSQLIAVMSRKNKIY